MSRSIQERHYVGKAEIEFCMACSRGHFIGHSDTRIRSLAEFLTELLPILSCIMKS